MRKHNGYSKPPVSPGSAGRETTLIPRFGEAQELTGPRLEEMQELTRPKGRDDRGLRKPQIEERKDTMKKLISLVLAIMMVAVVGLAFADGAGSITMSGSTYVADGETTTTYEAYRIFDIAAAVDSNGDAIMDGAKYASMAYTIATKWDGFFTGTAAGAAYIVNENVPTANSGKGYTPIIISGSVKYIALTESNVATFAKAALAYAQTTPVAADASNTTGSFTGLDLGYWMVYPKGANINVDGQTSIVSLTSTTPNATIIQKAKYPTLEKEDDDDSVEVGQTVTYTLTSTIPDTTGYKTFDFTFHDQMTAGLTFDGADSISVVIENGETDVTVPATGTGAYTYATETPGADYATAFKVGIPVMSYQEYVGHTITVTYTAKVNDNAVIHIDKNHATLEYSRDPKDDTKKTTTPPDEEEVFSAKIVIDKYDGTNASAKLAGASFVLRCKSVTDTGAAAHAEAGKYYKYTAATATTPAVVEWVSEANIDAKVTASQAALVSDIANAATVATTVASGAAEFPGLENGVYELIEVAAPTGYNQIKGIAAEVTVNGNKTETTSLTATSHIANNSGTELPSTGGMGTTIFYIVGSLLLVGAAIVLISRRKAND